MQKRVVHLILAIIFLTTTIVQSFGSALAVAVNKETMTANTTSKIVNPRSAIEGANSVSESLASSLQSQSTSSASTSSDSKSSSKSSDAKSSSNSTSEKESTKAPTTSKSVLIQPRVIDGDTGYQYPDFSKTLSSQKGIITVNYDDAGNAHTSVADDSGTLVPDDSLNEIPYPNNAFPVYIPGVSTETLHGKLATAKNYQLSAAGLDGDKDYIYYTKIMAFRDGNGKQHWIDIKQKFMGLEKHGWYNDWPLWKAKGYKSTSLDSDFVTNWGLGYGLGSNTNKSLQGLFGIGSTFKLNGFRTASMTSPAGAAYSDDAKANHEYRQAAKVKLEFYDNETGKPITISGFFTVADLDHRDFLQFSRDSNIQSVYVTNNTVSNNTLKGTFNPASDPSTVIVNNIGNNEYTDRNGNFANNGDEWGDNYEVINPDNTDAWATVTFHESQSVEYAVSDWQRMDFLPTALVPVAFSAPGKSGDGDEWNKDWDDNNINYNVVATLPYRGSTIKNPQHGTAESDTISTFHPTEKFELTDPINKNLKVDKVTIMQDGVTDVTTNFDIDTTGNKVTAKAKADFLGKEDNYAKTYNMKIETSVAADADLGSLPTVTATDDKGIKHTYAKIANTAHLDVVKAAGAKAEGWDSNEAFGHVQVPDPVREVQDMKQEIKNYDTAGEDWQPVVDDMSTTQGHVGDKVGYRFSFKAKDSNTASITDASINAISVNPGLSAPTNAKVTVGSTTTDGTIVEGSTPGVYSIKIDTPIKKGETVTVTFERTANKKGVYMQNGFLKAASLTAAPAGHNLVPDGYMFNFAVINVAEANNTATIQQFIKNRDTANESWKGPGIGDDKAETSGVPGNIIDYKFKITPGAKNTADLLATALKDIAMKESGGMTLVNPEGSVDNTKQVKITVDGSQPIYIGGNPISNNAELNDVFTPLTKGKGMTIEYSAKINATAAVQDVTNDANFYASNLTGNMPAASTVADKAHKTPANQSVLHITMPLQTPTIKQTINNTTSGVASTNDGKTAVGKAGDIIDYQFYVNAPATADKNLISAALKDIQMRMDATTDMTLVPYDATATTPGTTGQEVKVYMNHMSGKPVWASVADFKNGTVKIPTNPDMTAPVWIQVNYRMKIGTSATDGETITNDGNLYADNLQGTDHKMAFNQTVLNIKNKHAATSLKQTIHNITRPALDDKTETDPAKTATKSAGKLGDTIEYKFSAKATDTNTSDLMNVALDHIKMATTLSPADPNYMTLVKDPTISISINNGGTITTGTEADFNAGKFVFGNVAAKATISVTYRMKVGTDKAQTITNSGWLTADNLEGTTVIPNVTPEQKGIQFNDTILTIVPQVNHATIEQFIRNPRTNPTNQAWFGPGYGDGKAETTAAPGDEITYLFKIQLPTDTNGKYTNDAALLNAALKDIAMNKPDDMTLVNLDANGTKVQIDYATSPIEHRVNVNSLADLKDVALLSPLDTTNKTMMSSTGVVKVQYRAKVNANAPAQDVTNDANFYASNLTGDLKDQTVANYQQKTKANQSIVHIQGKKEVTIKQQIKNVFNPSENVSDPDDPKHQDAEGYSIETSGTKDDVIAYRFTVKAAKDNTGDITGLKVNNIKLDQPTKLTHTDDTSNQPYTLTVAIKNADNSSAGTDTGATFSASYDTITLTKPLKPGQTVTITYMMKITAEIDETPNGNNVIHNNGKLTADELTKSVTVGTVTNNEALKPDADGGKMTFNATILNLEKGVGKITIRYVDLDEDLSHPDVNVPTTSTDPAGSKISDSVTVTGKIGKPVSEGKYADGTPVATTDRLTPKVIAGYTITSVTETDPLSIANGWEAAYKDDPVFDDSDNRIITYGYQKRMISIKAPEKWDFGHYYRTQRDITYYLKASQKNVPEEVTIDDQYGVDKWQLQVEQAKPFMDDRKQELTNAELRFKNANITSETEENSSVGLNNNKINAKDILTSRESFELKATKDTAATVQNLMTYEHSGTFQKDNKDLDNSSKDNRYTDPGTGRWHYRFGTSKTADSSIGLFVPESTKRAPSTYRTTLTWSLTVAK